jgi:hypothetical protein
LPWSLSELNGTDSAALVAEIYYPCTILGSGSHAAPSYPSYLRIGGWWHNDAKTNYQVYAIAGGVNVLTASVSAGQGPTNTATFSPIGDTVVDGFRITLTAGKGTAPFYLTAFGELLEDDIYGNSTVCVGGEYYICTPKADGSFWSCNQGTPQYNFARHPDNTPYYFGVGYTQHKGSAPAGPGMSLSVPTGCYQTWARSGGLYAATAFISGSAGLGQFQFKRANTFATGEVAGGFVGQIYQAVLDGRRIDLGNCVIHNVCAP